MHTFSGSHAAQANPTSQTMASETHNPHSADHEQAVNARGNHNTQLALVQVSNKGHHAQKLKPFRGETGGWIEIPVDPNKTKKNTLALVLMQRQTRGNPQHSAAADTFSCNYWEWEADPYRTALPKRHTIGQHRRFGQICQREGFCN